MNPRLALLAWQHRDKLIYIAGAMVVGFVALVTTIGAAITIVPFVKDAQITMYQTVTRDFRAPDGSKIPDVSWQMLIGIDTVRYQQDLSRATEASVRELAGMFVRTITDAGGQPCAKGDPGCACLVNICKTLPSVRYERRTDAEVYDLLGFTPEQRRYLMYIGGVDFTFACTGFRPNQNSVYWTTFAWPFSYDEWPLSSCYGPRNDPVTGEPSYHYGVDIAAIEGTPVRAATDGRVTAAGAGGDYGNLLIIVADDGTQTWYGHLQDFVVSDGERVTRGQVVGHMGNTGKSTGPHLHFEIRPQGESPVNPLKFYS